MTGHPEWLLVKIADAINPVALEEGDRYAIAESVLAALFEIGRVGSWHRGKKCDTHAHAGEEGALLLVIPMEDPS